MDKIFLNMSANEVLNAINTNADTLGTAKLDLNVRTPHSIIQVINEQKGEGAISERTQGASTVVDGNTVKGLGEIYNEETEPVIDHIEITDVPTKIVYTEGETFDPTGMKVFAYYSDGVTKVEITDYTYTPTGALTIADTTVTVYYETFTDTTPITVEAEKEYLTFKSDTTFKLGFNAGEQPWDGHVYYSKNGTSWTEWEGNPLTCNSDNEIYLRGKSNTHLNYDENDFGGFTFQGGTNVRAIGKLAYVFDYTKASNKEHISMASYACYNLFKGCSQLAKAPDLSLLDLNSSCFNSMFYNCSGLTQVPELPATTLAYHCYYRMFYNCSSLVQAPELPLTTLAEGCYYEMFYGCSSLEEAPELPATTLTSDCYNGMFQNCAKLDNIVKLVATTLPSGCYTRMFSGCLKIKLSTTKVDDYQTEYSVPFGASSVSVHTSSLTNMFQGTGGSFTGTITADTTYYTSNELV